MHALRAFSIARPPSSKLRIAQPECCMVLKNHIPGSDDIFLYNDTLTLFPHFDINRRIAFAFKLS